MRRSIFRYGVCAWCAVLLCVAQATAQEAPAVQVRAELSPPQVPFHRTAEYRLVVEAPAGTALQWPDWTAKLDQLDVHAGAPLATPLPDGRERTVRTWKLEPLATADHLLPAMTVQWEGGSASVPPLAFQVRDLTQAEQEAATTFQGIVTPDAIAAPGGGMPWWVWAVAAALLGALAFWFYQRLRTPAPVVIVTPPWEVAQRRLQELAQRKLHEQGRFEPFYVDLSSILRYYLEDRFNLHAPEQTTQEFLETAQRGSAFTEEQQQSLAHLLRHCDRVKFAQYQPAADEMQESFSAVERFVLDTRPALAPGPGVPQEEAA
jgi:hypothetical protein